MIQQFFSENLLAIEMKRTHIILNKPVYLGLSILEMSKIVMCEFGYGYVKPKHGELQAKLYYMDTYRFIVFMKTKKNYVDIAKAVATRVDTSNYEFDKPLPTGKIGKKFELTKDELDAKIMILFAALKPKTCFYLTDDNEEKQKAQTT